MPASPLSPRHPEGGLADDQPVLEGPPRRLALRVDGEADRPELHLGDRVVPVPTLRRRRQADDVAGLHLGEHALERDGGQVVALVDDHVAVARDEVVDLVPCAPGSGSSRRRAGRSACACRRRSGRSPSARYRGTARAARPTGRAGAGGGRGRACCGPLRDEVGADDRLADAGRRDEHADVVREQRARRLSLDRRQLALERERRAARRRAAGRRRPARRRVREAAPRARRGSLAAARRAAAGPRRTRSPAASAPSRGACSASCRTRGSGRRRAA